MVYSIRLMASDTVAILPNLWAKLIYDNIAGGGLKWAMPRFKLACFTNRSILLLFHQNCGPTHQTVSYQHIYY